MIYHEYGPVPPKKCMSICSKKYIKKVLICGKRPRRNVTGKQYVNPEKIRSTYPSNLKLHLNKNNVLNILFNLQHTD